MPEPTVHDVDREIREAEAGVAALEQSVIDGDTTVTPESIEKAKDHVGFLRLRRRGAEKRQLEREQQERQEAYDEALAEREAFYSTGTAPAQQAYADLVDSIRAFQDELQKLRAAHGEVGARARDMGLEVPQDIRWLYGFESHHDGDGSTFLQSAFKEASGQRLPRPHGLHSDAIREEYAEREAEAARWEEERNAKYMAQFVTHVESPISQHSITA